MSNRFWIRKIYSKRLAFPLIGALAIIGGVLAIRYSQDLRSKAATPNSQVVTYNNQITQIVNSSGTTIASTSLAYKQLETTAIARKKLLLVDLRTDQARFLVELLPPDVLSKLPPGLIAKGLFEERKEIRGRMKPMHFDARDIKRSKTIPALIVDNAGKAKRYGVYFSGSKPALKSGDYYAMNGVALGSEYVATSTQSSSPVSIGRVASVPLTGDLKTLVVTFRFRSDGSPFTPPFSKEDIEREMFSTSTLSATNYYLTSSNNKLQLKGTVTNKWYEISKSMQEVDCENDREIMAEEAKRLAQADYGTDYQMYIYLFPNIPSCTYIGWGSPLDDAAWLNGFNRSDYYIHEIGHVFALDHANSIICGNQNLDAPDKCTIPNPFLGANDRNDPFDPMGFGDKRHLNAAYKNSLGWIQNTIATQTGVYQINALEINTSGSQLLTIDKPNTSTQNVKSTYAIEYRNNDNLDSGLSDSGVFVRMFNNVSNGYIRSSFLGDGSPNDSNLGTSSVQKGKSFTDNSSGLSVTPLTTTSSNATLLALLPDSNPTDTPPDPGPNTWLIRAHPVGCAASATAPLKAFYTFWGGTDPEAQNLQMQEDILQGGTHNVYINQIPQTATDFYEGLPFYLGMKTSAGETLAPVGISEANYFYTLMTSPYAEGTYPWFGEFWGVKWLNTAGSGVPALPGGTHTVKFFTNAACGSATVRRISRATSWPSQPGTTYSSSMPVTMKVLNSKGQPISLPGTSVCNDKGTCTPLATGQTTISIPLGTGQQYTNGSWATLTLQMPATTAYRGVSRRFCISGSHCTFPTTSQQVRIRLQTGKAVSLGWVLIPGVTPTPTPAVCSDMYIRNGVGSTHSYTTKQTTISSGQGIDVYMRLVNPIGSVQAWLRTYNLDNLVSGIPSAAYLNPNTKPDGYAAMTTLSANPPITQFAPQAGYSTSTREMHWHITYDQLRKADVNWGNRTIRNIQLNGFANSSSKASCVVSVTLN